LADIFISHAREDRERVKTLANALMARGWSVWWDQQIPVGKSFSEVIEQELAAARCVIVLWSKASVKSQWTLSEAAEGLARGILVPGVIDDARIPLEFRRLHTANLAGDSSELEHLLSSVASLLASRDASLSLPSAPTIAPASPRRVVITATLITLMLISITVWSTFDRSRGATDTAESSASRATATTMTSPMPQATGTTPEEPLAIDPERSAALIVGVGDFSNDDTLARLPYAVDDAVDLTYVLVMDARVRLIPAGRVVLAISGAPRKSESRERLKKLAAAGVRVRSAAQGDVIDALDKQAKAAGENGALFLAFATHGVIIDDSEYLLFENSLLRHHETAIAFSKIRDIASRSDAEQSLIFLDACRARSGNEGRSATFSAGRPLDLLLFGVSPPDNAVPKSKAQVVLSAAPPGGVAYDDSLRGNGVFTAAVIDGLQCGAETDERGLVTLHSLARYVEQRVRAWIRTNRDSKAIDGTTELTWVGPVKPMALAVCRQQ
jgi:TIR domain/Caspase domain